MSNKFERAIVKWPTERPGLRIGVIQHKDIIKRHNEPWAIVGKVYKVGHYGKTEHCQILWTGYLDSMKLNIMMSKYLTFYGFKTQLKRVKIFKFLKNPHFSLKIFEFFPHFKNFPHDISVSSFC